MWDGTERRKINRDAINNFQPNGAFEGYMKASIEYINARFDRLPCDDTKKRLGKVETDIANMKGKAAGIGAIAGIVATWIMKHLFGR